MTDTRDDLVERLRNLAAQSNDGYLRGPALQAADSIEQLTTGLTVAIKRLKAALTRAITAEARIAELERERDEAYERAAKVAEEEASRWGGPHGSSARVAAEHIRALARKDER